MAVTIRLTVGSVQDSINAVAAAAEVQSDTATVGRMVSSEQIANLQLNGRNPIFLASLVPGALRSNSISSFVFNMDNNVVINCARKEETNITFDGAPAVRTRSADVPIGVPDIDATQEVQILTASYNAEDIPSPGGLRGVAAEQNFWFTPASGGQPIFTAPAAGTFTTQRNRNLLHAPGFQSWNLSLAKQVALGERHRVQFRFEAFNWLNHPNWSAPGTNPRNLTTLGKVLSKNSERSLQMSLRYSF